MSLEPTAASRKGRTVLGRGGPRMQPPGHRPGARRVIALVVAVLVAAAGPAVVSDASAQAVDDAKPVPFARDPARDITGVKPAASYDLYSDGQTMYVLRSGGLARPEAVRAYSLADGTRDRAKDLDTPWMVHNRSPHGLWSDGGAFWVLDDWKTRFFAYGALPDNYDEYLGQRKHERFDMPGISADDGANGMWSDGETVWVAARNRGKLAAYDYDSGAELPERDFTNLAAAGNSRPAGLWSDGSTIWVSDHDDAKVYAYDLLSKQRQPDLDFDTLAAAGNEDPTGLWSDGEVMWVSNEDDPRLYAYNMPTAPKLGTLAVSGVKNLERTSGDAFSGLVARDAASVTVTATAHDSTDVVTYSGTDADTGAPGRQWLLGMGANTMQVTLTDGSDATSTKVYTLSVERVDAADTRDDAALLSLTVNGSPVRLPSSPAAVWATGVAFDVESLTVAATAADAAATVTISSADIDASAPGHQVRLFEETAWVVVRVVAAGGAAERTYRLRIDREPSPWPRVAGKDVTPDPSHGHDLDAVWSDGSTIWVSYDPFSSIPSIRAYDLGTGAHTAGKDITPSHNRSITGMWSDGETLWTADRDHARAVAYSLGEDDFGAHAADKSFDFGSELSSRRILENLGAPYSQEASGLWSDGEIMWVGSKEDQKLYAFDLNSQQRAPGHDIGTLAAAGNHDPNGLWSDGEIMWVSDADDRKVYAYDLTTKKRRPRFEFDALEAAGNHRPAGLWSDGETMWAVGESHITLTGLEQITRVFAFSMPAAPRVEWSATMSVGRGSAGGATLWGYSRWTSKGSLSPDRVELGVESTTVQLIGLDSAGDRLYLGLSERLSDDVTLVVGGTEFALAQAPPTRSAGWTHVWSAPDLDWSAGDEIEVEFVRQASSAAQSTDATVVTTTTVPAVTTTTVPVVTTTTVPVVTTTTVPVVTTTTVPVVTTTTVPVVTTTTVPVVTTTTVPVVTTTTVPVVTTTTVPVVTTTTVPVVTTTTVPVVTTTTVPVVTLLTASFADVPASHDGIGAFTLRVQFSESISISYVNVRDDVFAVTNGSVTKARRVDRRSDLWEITVDPSSGADIAIALIADAACGSPEAVCTSDAKQLSNNPSATIDGSD